MAAQSHEDKGKEPVDELIDDLIRDIMKESGKDPKEAAYAQDPLSAAMVEAAMSSLAKPISKGSEFEQLILSQAIATALADGLAPALARALAPEIMKTFGNIAGAQSSRREESAPGAPAPRSEKTSRG